MSSPGHLILTFDDGPIADRGDTEGGGALDTILKALEAHEVKAAFYVIGQEVNARPDLALRIVEEGHRVQNHSWDHPRLPSLSRAEIHKQLADTQRAIQEATGTTPDRLRPPYGAGLVDVASAVLAEVADELGLRLTGWDVDTNDWRKPRGLEVAKLAPPMARWAAMHDRRGRPLDVLMHVNEATARDLSGFIEGMKSAGWRFATYPESAPPPAARLLPTS